MRRRPHRAIRVLFFVSEYDRFNGAQRSLLQLVRNLPSAGVDPVVAFPGKGRCTAAYEAAGVPIEIIPAPASLNTFGQHLLNTSARQKTALLLNAVLPFGSKVVEVMRSRRINILHCNTTRSLLLAAAPVAVRRYPIVWHVRGQLHPFSRSVRLACQLLASRIILVAQALRSAIHPYFWRKCRVIYNAIDNEAVSGGNGEASLPFDPLGGLIIATMAADAFQGISSLAQGGILG